MKTKSDEFLGSAVQGLTFTRSMKASPFSYTHHTHSDRHTHAQKLLEEGGELKQHQKRPAVFDSTPNTFVILCVVVLLLLFAPFFFSSL